MSMFVTDIMNGSAAVCVVCVVYIQCLYICVYLYTCRGVAPECCPVWSICGCGPHMGVVHMWV